MIGIIHHVQTLGQQAFTNWVIGGWCMPAMAGNALVMFYFGIHVYMKLHTKKFKSVPENIWRNWLEHPKHRRGTVGELIEFVTKGNTIQDAVNLFQEVKAREVAPFDRDLRVMGVCASAAPLIGLLGTVTGILTLFAALAHGSGGEKTMKLISQGVSEALIATQTGLVVALPGLIFHHSLKRQHEQYKSFIARLETVQMQILYKKSFSNVIGETGD